MAFKSSTGPVKSSLDSVVDKLQEMNKDQTALQKESITYANELQDYVQNEGHALTSQQIVAMQEMILALKEGRLDDIEAQREELVRQRAEDRRDEERNDFLKDNLKQLQKQYKLLLKMFKDDKNTLLGLVFRTAVVGLLIGIAQGFISPYVKAITFLGGKLKAASQSLFTFFQFDKLFASIKVGVGNLKTNVINFFKNTRLAQFFTGKGGILSAVFTEMKMQFKDIRQIISNAFYNLKQIGRAVVGLFTGAPVAFAGLKDMRFAIDSNSKTFKAIGNFLNFVKKPFIKLGERIKTTFVIIGNVLGGLIDKVLNVITGKEGTRFANLGQNIRQFFSKSGPLTQFFSFFQKIQGFFVQIGKVLGSKLLFPLFGLLGGFFGMRDDIKDVKTQGEGIIRGYVGFIRGAFRILIGEFLDFIKQAIGFIIDLIPGVDGVREVFGKFSFADFFDELFFSVANFLVSNLNMIKDVIADISFGGLIKNMVLSIGAIFAKILDFPIAIAKGAKAAFGALPPGGVTPQAAFMEAYQAHLDSGLEAAVRERMEQIDGLDASGNEIDYLSDEFNALKQGSNNFGRGGIDLSSSSVTGGDTVNLNSGLMLGGNNTTLLRMTLLSGGGGGFVTGD